MLDEPALVELLAVRSTLEASETPIEPPVLRAALMSADAMSTLFGGIPS